MTRIAILAVITTILSVMPAYSGHNPQNLMDRAQGEVKALEDTAELVRNPVIRRDLQEQIQTLHKVLDRMQAQGAYQSSSYNERPPIRPPRAQNGLSYQEAMTMVRNEPFNQGKLSTVRRVARNGRFSTQQARSIADQLSFDQSKADALIALYPSVTDKYRFGTALSILDFQSNRRRVSNTLNL